MPAARTTSSCTRPPKSRVPPAEFSCRHLCITRRHRPAAWLLDIPISSWLARPSSPGRTPAAARQLPACAQPCGLGQSHTGHQQALHAAALPIRSQMRPTYRKSEEPSALSKQSEWMPPQLRGTEAGPAPPGSRTGGRLRVHPGAGGHAKAGLGGQTETPRKVADCPPIVRQYRPCCLHPSCHAYLCHLCSRNAWAGASVRA